MLQQSFRCIVTSSLRETYQAIVREQPTLVIQELNQPDGDGLELIAYLQAHPAWKNILIACVTQRATSRERMYAYRLGADDYLVKPLSAAFSGQMLMVQRGGLMARA